jgi:hypothetical protein
MYNAWAIFYLKEKTMIKPIPYHKNYFCNKDFHRFVGIGEDGITDLKIVDLEDNPVNLKEFFIKDNVKYVAISVPENTGTEEEPVIEDIMHYYSQAGNGSDVVEIAELPERPAIGYSTYRSKNFIMETYQYEGETVSRIKNLNMRNQAVFKQIFGFSEIKTGLYFNVIESRIPGKLEGLYFYPIDRKAVVFIDISLGTGFFW